MTWAFGSHLIYKKNCKILYYEKIKCKASLRKKIAAEVAIFIISDAAYTIFSLYNILQSISVSKHFGKKCP